MRFVYVLYLAFMIPIFAEAQIVAGTIKDEQGKPLPKASVALKRTKDSSVVKQSVTNTEGNYRFENLTAGKYFVSATHVGYLIKRSSTAEMSGKDSVRLPDLVLLKSTDKLKEVVVVNQKPLIEFRADKTIFNVEGSINATGNDALDLLRMAPGVMVDKDDRIILGGKNGVRIYIDGRPSPLAGQDLANYLKSLQSSSIESIEIITNPSAKYDAAGSAGIINIRLKKNLNFGTNASVNAGYNQGIFPKFNTGLVLNNRKNKINFFANYNFSDRRNESSTNIYRRQLDSLFDQQSTMGSTSQAHNFKAGVDYFMNKRSTWGIMVNGGLSESRNGNYSYTAISHTNSGELIKYLIADNKSESERNNLHFNLNYRYVGARGHELDMDADYGYYNLKSNQLQPNYYYTKSGQLTDQRIYNMQAPTQIDMATFKIDYQQNFKKGRLGFGGKLSRVSSDNDFQRFNLINTVKVLDTLRSNVFNYTENINAAYVNYVKNHKKIGVQFGVRLENVNAKGRSLGYKWDGGYKKYDSAFTRHYTDLFPSLAITFKKNTKNQFSLTYSRRIDRPSYQDLNPFEFKLDEYTFQKGNTQLRPQYTHSIGITHSYKYRLNTRINYSHVKDMFTQLVDTVEKSKTFLSKRNLATQDIISLNINYSLQLKWYSLIANAYGYYSRYKADFGTGRTIDRNVITYNLYAQQVFQLGKGFSSELSANYYAPTIWQGTFKTGAIWGVDAGLQKVLFKGKANVKASVSDIFRKMGWSGSSNFAGQTLTANGLYESRMLKCSFSYRFGNNKVKAARQRKLGLEEESQRVGTQGEGLNTTP